MTKSRMNPKVDFYFNKAKKWQKELEKLRMTVLDCELAEELKWGVPCYTFQKSNIVIIQGFKELCALMFCKGALLNNPTGILGRFYLDFLCWVGKCLSKQSCRIVFL